jgi:hypothetical protein
MSVDELHEALNQAYRFRIPRAFAEAAVASRGFDEWKAFGFNWVFQRGRRLRTTNYESPGYVPDLFTFGRPGVDGLADGFIVHAPELEFDELPVFEHDPAYGTMNPVAGDFRSALFNFAAWHSPEPDEDLDGAEEDHIEREDRDLPSAYAPVARALDLPVVPTPSRARNDPFEFVPDVPPGWRFVATDDRVGVLAPADSFGGDPIDVDGFRAKYCERDDDVALRRRGIDPLAGADEMLETLVRACCDVLKAGYPGSALVAVRRTNRAMGGISTDSVLRSQVLSVWADVNDALGRSLIADILREAITEQQREREECARRLSSWR